MSWRSLLPYEVSFRARIERVEPPWLIEGRVEGHLRGTGRCRVLEPPDGGTTVVFDLAVETAMPWMNLVAPLGRPVFAWNHDVLMRRGGEGIARELGCSVARSQRK